MNTLAFACAATVGAGCAGWLRYGVAGRNAQMFGPSVYRGPGLRRSIALTFDDGPSAGSLVLAEYLAKHGIRATFFQCGTNIWRHPEIARSLSEAGHELGNHTDTHPRLCPRMGWKVNVLSARTVEDEFARAQTVLRECVGVTPLLLRAPYGLRWRGMGAVQARLNLLGVMWTAIGHDWEWDAERVTRHLVARASPGGIVCLHDGRETQPHPDVSVMLAAVRSIVPRLIDLGYKFETVSEILRA